MKKLWTEIQKEHPDMWAILGERDMSGADIIQAELIGLCDDTQVAQKKIEARNAGKSYWFVRTTTRPIPSYIHVSNAKNLNIRRKTIIRIKRKLCNRKDFFCSHKDFFSTKLTIATISSPG